MQGNNRLTRFGRYDVVAKIGEGGFGEVFEAYDPDLKRRVAIKTCSSDEPELIARFEHEAELAGSLHHGNLTATYDFSKQDDPPYLVQEFLEGEDLDQAIARRDDLSITARLQYLIQLARGLKHAHSRRVIHRDVKPANVRVLPDGRIKLMDFGIAQSLDDDAHLTLAGETMGTAAYLAPEQIRGEKVDARSDVYSFGVTAYELLCFERPFPGDDADTVLQAVLDAAPPPLTEHWPDCPEALATLIQRCMQPEPADRYGDFGPVLHAFDSILGSDSTHSSMRIHDVPEVDRSHTQEGQADSGLTDATLVMSADQIANAGLPGQPRSPRSQHDMSEGERTHSLEQSTVLMAPTDHPAREPGSNLTTRPDPSPAAGPATLPVSAAPQAKGLSLTSFVFGLALMGFLGAAAATWFFGREQAPAPEVGASASATDTPSSADDGARGRGTAQDPQPPAPSGTQTFPDQPAGQPKAVTEVTSAEMGILVLPAAWDPRMTARVAGQSLKLERFQEIKLPTGPHTVVFRLDDDPNTGWNESQSERRQVRITSDRRQRLETLLEPPGAVTLRAALGAPQAFIRIDGDPIGWAPISEQALPPGRYQVNASRSATESQNATSFPLLVNSAEETVITFNIDSAEPPVTSTKSWVP